MIEIKHTRADGTTWSEWVPEPVEEYWESIEGQLHRDWGTMQIEAQRNLNHEWQEALAALKSLAFRKAAAHTKAMWAWAKVVAMIKKGPDC